MVNIMVGALFFLAGWSWPATAHDFDPWNAVDSYCHGIEGEQAGAIRNTSVMAQTTHSSTWTYGLSHSGSPALPGSTSGFGSFAYITAGSTMPERIRFRYQSGGAVGDRHDGEATSIDASTKPGSRRYRFEVVAIDEAGARVPVVATSEFQIYPRLLHTKWAAFLSVLLLAPAIYAFYSLSLNRSRRARLAQTDARTMERERIARTLHDTFLQSLQGIIFRLDTVRIGLAKGTDERQQIEHILEAARKVAAEGREQLFELRAPCIERNLYKEIEQSTEVFQNAGRAPVSVRESGAPFLLSPEEHGEVYFIACEAITNALRHAWATRIDVILDWTAKGLRLTVTDDGVGIDETLLMHGRLGHWGLIGMRERALQAGAALTIRNRLPGSRGVEIVLELPHKASATLRRHDRLFQQFTAMIGKRENAVLSKADVSTLESEGDRVGTIASAKLTENGAHVALHRRLADTEGLADNTV
jgi:signal transduction histidine kinase